MQVKAIYKDDVFKPLPKLTYNTSNYITSYINNKDIINTTVRLSRSIPEEDIEDILEIKAYEELGLDQANSYLISSFVKWHLEYLCQCGILERL